MAVQLPGSKHKKTDILREKVAVCCSENLYSLENIRSKVKIAYSCTLKLCEKIATFSWHGSAR